METIFSVLIAAGALGIFIWLIIPSRGQTAAGGGESTDAAEARLIGMIVGMTGGGVADAAVAKFALQRFEETHGRKATMQDAGTVAGLISGMKK